MLQKMRVLLLVCITAVLAACGGGGGDETPNFAGTYLLNEAVVSSNTCGGSVANLAGGGRVDVIQNGRNLTWVEAGGSYPGTVDTDNGGFTVITFQSGVLVTVAMRSGGGSSYSAKITASGGCTIVWSGTAVKTS